MVNNNYIYIREKFKFWNLLPLNLKVKTYINNVNKTFMFNTNTSFKSKLNYLIKTNNNIT